METGLAAVITDVSPGVEASSLRFAGRKAQGSGPGKTEAVSINGPDVEVKVLRGKNVVATVPAKLAQGKSAYGNTITTRTVNNPKTLDQVDFAGGKQSLVFAEATATESSSGQQ